MAKYTHGGGTQRGSGDNDSAEPIQLGNDGTKIGDENSRDEFEVDDEEAQEAAEEFEIWFGLYQAALVGVLANNEMGANLNKQGIDGFAESMADCAFTTVMTKRLKWTPGWNIGKGWKP